MFSAEADDASILKELWEQTGAASAEKLMELLHPLCEEAISQGLDAAVQ